jgi:hypothetical protein
MTVVRLPVFSVPWIRKTGHPDCVTAIRMHALAKVGAGVTKAQEAAARMCARVSSRGPEREREAK